MSSADDLESISRELRDIVSRFREYRIAAGDEAEFKRLVLDAKNIVDDELGAGSTISRTLLHTANDAVSNYIGTPSLAGVRDTDAVIRSAINAIRRKKVTSNSQSRGLAAYVDVTRLDSIRSAPKHRWDLARLGQLCVELNSAHESSSYMSVAMLVRCITDHVAPVFGCKNFGEVANNLQSDQSFKKSMRHLNESLRNIADGVLHVQIRQVESLPTPTQVDFRADLDRLLEEVVRRVSLP